MFKKLTKIVVRAQTAVKISRRTCPLGSTRITVKPCRKVSPCRVRYFSAMMSLLWSICFCKQMNQDQRSYLLLLLLVDHCLISGIFGEILQESILSKFLNWPERYSNMKTIANAFRLILYSENIKTYIWWFDFIFDSHVFLKCFFFFFFFYFDFHVMFAICRLAVVKKCSHPRHLG